MARPRKDVDIDEVFRLRLAAEKYVGGAAVEEGRGAMKDNRTREQRSAAASRAAMARTPEERVARAKKAAAAYWEGLTPEQRSVRNKTTARAMWDKLTPEQRSARAKNGAAASAKVRSAAAKAKKEK